MALDRLFARHALNMLAKHGDTIGEQEFLTFVEREQSQPRMTLEQAKATADSFFSKRK